MRLPDRHLVRPGRPAGRDNLVGREKILSKIEEVIELSIKPADKRSAKDFLGRWSEKDAGTIEKIIEEGCEQIHPDDWK